MKGQTILVNLLLAGAYLVAAKLGLSLAVPETNVSPVWPPSGIALAAMLLWGFRVWPGIAVGAFLANYFIGLSLVGSTFTAAGNTLEAVFATFLIHRLASQRNLLSRANDIFYFVVAALAGSAIASTIGTSTSLITGFSKDVSYLYLWITWWLGDTVGIIVVAPVLISWGRHARPALHKAELIRLLTSVLLLSLAAFVIFTARFNYSAALSYVTLLPLLVIAFHFDERGASIGAFALSGIAVWRTHSGYGPFLGETVDESLLLLQLFLGITTVTALVVSIVISEKRDAQKTIQDQLQEKELLLSEVHHRVKNNLQVISSLLGLQLSYTDHDGRDLLKESQNRLRSMALIHERLYEAGNLSRIDFGSYTRDLIEHLFQAYAIDPARVKVEIDCEQIELDIHRAVPCALILNEIVTNSLKHAFPDPNKGRIEIRCSGKHGKIVLEARDDGPGIPHEIGAVDTARTLGLRLITLLVSQLKGKMQVDNSSGAAYRIEF